MSASTHVSLEDTSPQAPLAQREEQVAALTGLRGLAALMVVVVHSSFLTSYAWIGIPNYGPMSLFVLSGFLLYRPWSRWALKAAGRPVVTTFFRRRVARIFPAYLTVFFVVTMLYPPSRPTGPDGWLQMITLTWIYQDDPWPSEFAQTWSLATELSWYVALPVLGGVTALVARRRSQRTGFWVAAGMISLALPITIGWRLWVSTLPATDPSGGAAGVVPYFMWLPSFLACFAGGALVAHLAEGHQIGIVSLRWLRRVCSDRWAAIVFVAVIALLGTSELGGPPGWPETFGQEQVRQVCAFVIALTLLTVVVFGGAKTPLNRVLSTSWATAIGRWSYGIFLWHMPLLLILETKIDYPPGVLGFLLRLTLVLGLAVPLSAATYVWVEQPAIAWSHQRPRRGTSGQRNARDPRRARDRTSEETAAPMPSATSRTTIDTQPSAASSVVRPTSTPGE